MGAIFKNNIVKILLNIIILIILAFIIFNVTTMFFNIGKNHMQQEAQYAYENHNN